MENESKRIMDQLDSENYFDNYDPVCHEGAKR